MAAVATLAVASSRSSRPARPRSRMAQPAPSTASAARPSVVATVASTTTETPGPTPLGPKPLTEPSLGARPQSKQAGQTGRLVVSQGLETVLNSGRYPP